MEPRQSGPPSGYEQRSTGEGFIERSPVTPELVGDTTRERPAENAERQEREPLPPPTMVPMTPVLPTPVVQDTPTPTPTDDTTMLAADEDLIEKEWVDRAKKILNETKDNPYARELAVSKLQAEYIQKRYGKIIGKSTE